MREVIAEREGTIIEVSDSPCTDYLHILGSVMFGAEGSRYRRVDPRSHAARLGASFFFVAKRGATALGIYALTPWTLDVEGKSVESVYRSQLCVIPTARQQGVAAQLRDVAMRWIQDRLQPTAFLSWGCVDESNTHVIRLLERKGVEHFRTLTRYLCYRQWPQRSPELASTIPSFATDVPAIELCEFGRAMEFLTRYLFRFIGPAKRRFDPDNFRYVRLLNLRYSDHDEDSLAQLISHCMAAHSTHYAVLDCNTDDPQREQIRRGLGRFVQTKQLFIMAQNVGLPDDVLARIKDHPASLSPLDI